jgi:Zn-dependent protease
MIKPAFLEPEDRPTVVGRVFGTPMVVKGWTGLPLIELVAWGILSCVAGRKNPAWSLRKRVSAGAMNTIILLGSEWCHNLAHTAIAYKIRRPVDAIRIFFGTPLLIYYDVNDQHVKPSQHLLRAVGGPVFNALMIPLCWLIKFLTPAGTLPRYSANFALGTNVVLSTVSLLPIPGIDGGPLLKWSLVETGRTIEAADEIVKKVNLTLGSALVVSAGMAVKKRRKWLGAFLAAFAVTSLAIGVGLLKEQKKP